jgi:hypothetical protein
MRIPLPGHRPNLLAKKCVKMSEAVSGLASGNAHYFEIG